MEDVIDVEMLVFDFAFAAGTIEILRTVVVVVDDAPKAGVAVETPAGEEMEHDGAFKAILMGVKHLVLMA